MDKLHSTFEKVCSRIKLALLVLKGIVPTHLDSGSTLDAIQAELASARAETSRLAAALTDSSLDPNARAEELLEARNEIDHLNAELAALRTGSTGIKSLAVSAGKGGSNPINGSS